MTGASSYGASSIGTAGILGFKTLYIRNLLYICNLMMNLKEYRHGTTYQGNPRVKG